MHEALQQVCQPLNNEWGLPMEQQDVTYRKASQEDIPVLIEMRKQQLIDEGSIPRFDIDMELHAFLQSQLTDGSLVQFLVEDRGQPVATGGIIFYLFPPSFINQSGKKGYIMSMYTRDEYRGQGIAYRLLELLVEEARARDVSYLWLCGSPMGRTVYRRFGFAPAGSPGELWMEMHLE